MQRYSSSVCSESQLFQYLSCSVDLLAVVADFGSTCRPQKEVLLCSSYYQFTLKRTKSTKCQLDCSETARKKTKDLFACQNVRRMNMHTAISFTTNNSFSPFDQQNCYQWNAPKSGANFNLTFLMAINCFNVALCPRKGSKQKWNRADLNERIETTIFVSHCIRTLGEHTHKVAWEISHLDEQHTSYECLSRIPRHTESRLKYM